MEEVLLQPVGTFLAVAIEPILFPIYHINHGGVRCSWVLIVESPRNVRRAQKNVYVLQIILFPNIRALWNKIVKNFMFALYATIKCLQNQSDTRFFLMRFFILFYSFFFLPFSNPAHTALYISVWFGSVGNSLQNCSESLTSSTSYHMWPSPYHVCRRRKSLFSRVRLAPQDAASKSFAALVESCVFHTKTRIALGQILPKLKTCIFVCSVEVGMFFEVLLQFHLLAAVAACERCSAVFETNRITVRNVEQCLAQRVSMCVCTKDDRKEVDSEKYEF